MKKKNVSWIYLFVILAISFIGIESCDKNGFSVPLINTAGISEIAQTSFTCRGNIQSDGGEPITDWGVCWGTNLNPSISDNKTTGELNDRTFTCNITGLNPNTHYYVRAYATNSVGTGYGNGVPVITKEIQVPVLTTSAISLIALTTATCGGTINSDGGAPVTICGVCWSNNPNPTVDDKKTSVNSDPTFTCTIDGLSPKTTYYVRAYATNSEGTGYGNELSFTTNGSQVPVVTTSPIVDVTQTSATCGGIITSEGDVPVTAYGIIWDPGLSPTLSYIKASDNLNNGTFTVNLDGLTPNATYYVRAYATNSTGTGYGSRISFKTLEPEAQIPVLNTSSVKDISQTSATSGGTIISDGGAYITSSGVCWSTLQHPTISDSKTSENMNIGTFTSNLTGLLANTTYYVRSYATNSTGTGYGDEISFQTLEEVIENKEYRIHVDFECGEALLPSDWPNIYVIWMENESSSFIQNMFICKKLIYGGLTGTALPYWKVNKYPKSLTSEVDAVTSATVPNQNFTVSATLKDSNIKTFKLYFEIDHSFDQNDWFSDQPALLYSADINLNDTIFELSPVGWTPNENTENQVPNTSNGKLESEMRYITNLKSGSTFGAIDSRSSAKMVKKIKVRIEK